MVDLPIQISPNNNIVEINPSKPVGDETSNQINDRPFLLLDVRQVEDFERCHIIMAKSYPASRLTRAVNFETRWVLFQNNFLSVPCNSRSCLRHTWCFLGRLAQAGVEPWLPR